jgi:hypothetical protein
VSARHRGPARGEGEVRLEHYRPIDAAIVPPATRLAAERMRRYARRDLRLRTMKVAWFAADDRPLSAEEWTDPVKIGLNSGPIGKKRGLVSTEMPSVVWCRSDQTLFEVAETVAHEARHVWQLRQKAWRKPAPEPGASADDFISAVQQWDREREQDAEQYAERQAPVTREIARSLAANSAPDSRRGTTESDLTTSPTPHSSGLRPSRRRRRLRK